MTKQMSAGTPPDTRSCQRAGHGLLKAATSAIRAHCRRSCCLAANALAVEAPEAPALRALASKPLLLSTCEAKHLALPHIVQVACEHAAPSCTKRRGFDKQRHTAPCLFRHDDAVTMQPALRNIAHLGQLLSNVSNRLLPGRSKSRGALWEQDVSKRSLSRKVDPSLHRQPSVDSASAYSCGLSVMV